MHKRKSDRGLRRRRRRRRLRRRVSRLPDDLIAEILARVPYMSLCRLKCVSRLWLALCSDDRVLSRCPQTLSGFFYNDHVVRGGAVPRFVFTSWESPPMWDPPFSFLSARYSRDMYVVDSCNGLLLCDRRNMRAQAGSRYIVCNPETEKWTELPNLEPMKRLRPAIRLGFDPAVSPHFSVFFVVHAPDDLHMGNEVMGVQIYSSETRGWTYRQSEWGDKGIVRDDSRSAFFNGALHLTSLDSLFSIVTVDRDGKTWSKITTPRNFDCIGVSQGHLYAVHRDSEHNDYRLSVWALEDYRQHKWILKHTLSALEMFGTRKFYIVQGIHPERSSIFLTAGARRDFMSYNVDDRKVCTVCTLGHDSARAYPYIPYLSNNWLVDGH
ncbi:unnamed protein product [Urochloa humidicola]